LSASDEARVARLEGVHVNRAVAASAAQVTIGGGAPSDPHEGLGQLVDRCLVRLPVPQHGHGVDQVKQAGQVVDAQAGLGEFRLNLRHRQPAVALYVRHIAVRHRLARLGELLFRPTWPWIQPL
jgi:hypothetical protein